MADTVSRVETSHWQKVNAELDQKVVSRVAPLSRHAKTWFYGIHVAIHEKLDSSLFVDGESNPPWKKLRNVAGRLSTKELSKVYGLIFLGFMGGLRRMWSLENWKTSMGAAADLYHVPQATIDQWIQLVCDHEAENDFDLKVFAKLGGAIAAATGQPEEKLHVPWQPITDNPREKELLEGLGSSLHGLTNAMDPLHWRLFMAEVADRSHALCKQPNWESEIDAQAKRAAARPARSDLPREPVPVSGEPASSEPESSGTLIGLVLVLAALVAVAGVLWYVGFFR